MCKLSPQTWRLWVLWQSLIHLNQVTLHSSACSSTIFNALGARVHVHANVYLRARRRGNRTRDIGVSSKLIGCDILPNWHMLSEIHSDSLHDHHDHDDEFPYNRLKTFPFLRWTAEPRSIWRASRDAAPELVLFKPPAMQYATWGRRHTLDKV